MIAPCVDCGTPTGLVDDTDFYFRCIDHLIGGAMDVSEVDPPLTPRELQVALYTADGYTNQEIGAELNLTTAYIRNIVSRVLRQLGVTNRRMINRSLREYGL